MCINNSNSNNHDSWGSHSNNSAKNSVDVQAETAPHRSTHSFTHSCFKCISEYAAPHFTCACVRVQCNDFLIHAAKIAIYFANDEQNHKITIKWVMALDFCIPLPPNSDPRGSPHVATPLFRSRHAIDEEREKCDRSAHAKNCEHIFTIHKIQPFHTK